MLRRVITAATCAALCACGGGGDSASDAKVAGVDNAANSPLVTNSTGYSGGGVVLGGQKIVGEWSATRTLSKSGARSAFVSTDKYAVLGVKFADVGYSEYWADFSVTAGKVGSVAAWTPIGTYGVSQDGSTLIVDKTSTKFTFTVKSVTGSCVKLVEAASGDEYDLCKTA